ncbi:MAG: AMP-binding protein, partial [Planctomycetota bacterium]|nr:AMP-binding protein [Planctomycetota bacterium]
LTETSPVVSFNAPGSAKEGTVGRVIRDVEVKLDEDGEILVRGPNVMQGYYQNPDATAEVMTEDGFFRTGDIGEIDEEQYLRITDRKKDILVTSGGKNIPPQKIENLLRSDPFIQEIVVCGDGRNYLTALIVPAFDMLERHARQEKIRYYEVQDLVENPQIHGLLQKRIEALQATLPRFEQIKKFTLLNKELSFEDGEVTPTMKIRRVVIYEKYRDEIERMYDPTALAVTRAEIQKVLRESAGRSRGTIDKARRPRLQQTLAGMFQRSVDAYGRKPALWVPSQAGFEPVTYARLGRLVREFGLGLISLGVDQKEPVALISDNRFEWLLSDLAILSIGGVDVPRGTDSVSQEIAYIFNHAETRIVMVEDKRQLEKILEIRAECPKVKKIIVLDEAYQGGESKDILAFDDVLKAGRALVDRRDRRFDERIAAIHPSDPATIIYTSGTTGKPKGVVLSHANMMHNVRVLPPLIQLGADDRFLSILPSWHSFERIVEYVGLSKGALLAYSKPVRKILLRDLAIVKPTFMAAVPRVLEGIHTGVLGRVKKQGAMKRVIFRFSLWVGGRYDWASTVLAGMEAEYTRRSSWSKKLRRIYARLVEWSLRLIHRRMDRAIFKKIRDGTGGSLRGIVSGGGALPDHVEDFFRAIGMVVLEGYGLTETSPVVAVRTLERRPPHTVGPPLPETEIRIVDEQGRSVPHGEKGVVHVRGPQVMAGYHRDPEATERVIDGDGWFDTGDLGRLTIHGDLEITGRAKDTIVLLSGENIEPEPLEGKLKQSPLISQVMIVGQDKKYLGALIVPDLTGLSEGDELDGMDTGDLARSAKDPRLKEIIGKEIDQLINAKNGFRRIERVHR